MITRVDPADFDASAAGPAAELRRVVAACDAYDRVSTLNEQAQLELKNRGLRDAALWVSGPAPSVGDVPATVDGFALLRGDELDLAVHPGARGHGTGTALATAALAGVPRVDAWSHADHPAAARLAARFGVPRARELKIMVRPTALPLTAPPAPDGVRVRTFRPGDETALLRVNAAAFAHHPEQGDLTSEDFRDRTSESWFDPAGLFVAEDEHGELLGFHWTKVHRDEDPPYGEVYVVAVDPRAAGRGLGTVLTHAGLAHLASTGVAEVILYVDGDNDPAIAVYRRQGFTDRRTEVQYRGTPRLP